MNRKNQILVKLAGLLIGVMFAILFIVIVSALHSKEVMVNERKALLSHMTDSAISIAAHHQRQVDLGDLTLQEAQETVRRIIRNIRYSDQGYFFIYDTEGMIIAHAYHKDMEGKNFSELKDARNIPYIHDQIQKALAGGGYATYHYIKPKRGEDDHAKVTHVRLFEPWQWVFATGLYVDDIEAAYSQRLYAWAEILLPVFLLLGILTFLLGRAIIKPVLQLENSIRKAEEATKAKSDFLANMSHEIRTPLNGAMGMMALLLGTNMSNQQREWTQISYQSCEELLNLINDILDISKVEADQMVLEKVPFDLQATVKTVTDLLYVRAQRKGLDLFVTFQSDLPRFLIGDPVRVRQILLNLVGNAVKFTQQGYIMISVEGHKQAGAWELKMEVKDTGPGIPDNKQSYIFEKFSQAEESTTRHFGGTGLGLAICRKLTGLMGGTIGVRSVEGQGSTFYFTAQLEEETATPSIGSSPLHAMGETILIDSLSDMLKAGLLESLRGASFMCVDARQGGGVLAMLQQGVALGQPYHYAIIDMPDPASETEGLSVRIDELQKASMQTHLVFIVPPDRVYENESIILEKGVGILTRPVFPQDLFDVIKTLVEAAQKNNPPSFVSMREENVAHYVNEHRSGTDDRERLVLVAEDQKINQILMRTVLEQMGCKTDMASNGVEAVQMAARKQYDLIFMDGHMPEMDGLEATKQIREFEALLHRHTPIVALTADAMKGDRDKCLAAGMDDYLHKPVKAEQIKGMLDRYT